MEETFQRLQLHSLIRFFNILASILDFCPTLMKKMYFLIHHYMSKQTSAKNCAFKIKKEKTGCTGRSCRDSPMWLWGFNEQHSKNVNIGSIFQALKRVHRELPLRFQMFCRLLESITDTSTEDKRRRNCLWRFLRARAFIAVTAGRRYREGGCTAEVDYIQINRWKVKLVEQKVKLVEQKSKFTLFNERYRRKFLQLVEMQETNPE